MARLERWPFHSLVQSYAYRLDAENDFGMPISEFAREIVRRVEEGDPDIPHPLPDTVAMLLLELTVNK